MCIATKPRPRTTARAESVVLDLGGLVKVSLFTAFAAHYKLSEIAAGSSLIQPQLTTTRVSRTMDEETPVEIVNVPTDEACRDDVVPIETPPLVKRLTMYKTPGSNPIFILIIHLNNKPLWKSPRPDTSSGFAGILGIARGSEELCPSDFGKTLELTDEARFDDFREIARLGPGIESAYDGGILWQVDQCPRTPCSDHLTLADLSVRFLVH
jgi:hypothetical protein